MTRSYSDPSYGSLKVFQSQLWSLGTRATAVVDTFTHPGPFTVTDWSAVNTVVGTGGPSTWVLASTNSAGTSALGTFTFAGTHGASASISGTLTETDIPAGGNLHLYSILSTASPAPVVRFSIEYKERFVENDT